MNFATGGTNRLTIDSNGFRANSKIPNSFPAVPSITVGNPSGNTAIFEGTDATHLLEIAWLNQSFVRVTTTDGQPLARQDEGGSVRRHSDATGSARTSWGRSRRELRQELGAYSNYRNMSVRRAIEKLCRTVSPSPFPVSSLASPVYFDWRANEYPEVRVQVVRAVAGAAQVQQRDGGGNVLRQRGNPILDAAAAGESGPQ